MALNSTLSASVTVRRKACAKVWPTMYETLLKIFEGVDNQEYKDFTATLHKMIQNIRKHEI